MNSSADPLLGMLGQWTALLALAWGVHGFVRHRHSRWRLILWRAMLCFAFLVPLMRFAPVVVLRVPMLQPAVSRVGTSQLPAPTRGSAPVPGPLLTAQASAKPAPLASDFRSVVPSVPGAPIQWRTFILVAWGLGVALGVSRLGWLQSRLRRIQAEASPAAPSLQQQAREVQARLRVRRSIAVLVSARISSSFVCGLFRPAVLIPQRLLQSLPPEELSVLLAHEVAHLRRHDLFWCVAWRWMQALFWFHPLVWRIPAAHGLACEQEADRIAASQVAEGSSYPQLLARLAWRILVMPQVETRLVLNATSQITQRLNHLRRTERGGWDWRHSVAAFTLVACLFLAVTGCRLSMDNQPKSTAAAPLEFKKVMVVVQAQDGKPIEGASITPDGFRVEGIHSPDAYSWRTKEFGPPETAITDPDGEAFLKYPVMGIAEEKERTGALIFSVRHPEYCTAVVQTFLVNGSDNPIQMTRGVTIEVSGAFGRERQPVRELVASLTEPGIRAEDWERGPNGSLSFHRVSAGGHLLQLMGKLPSGEIVFSDTIAFTAEAGKPCQFALEMRPGIRLEGRLDDRVPRPVRNARVMLDVRPEQYPALQVIEDFYNRDKEFGGRKFWHSYRPIAEDGTFIFESLPPGEADIVVLGDGFATKDVGQIQNRTDGGLKPSPGMSLPQPCPLVAPVTKVEVATEATAALEFTAITKSGKPIEGAWVGMYPSVFRMRGMYGWAKITSEEPFCTPPPLPDPVFSGKTDRNGKLVLRNIPGHTRGIEVFHPEFQVPLQDLDGWRDRHLRESFSPGKTNVLNLVLDPRGTDFIGSR